jgi:DNA primase
MRSKKKTTKPPPKKARAKAPKVPPIDKAIEKMERPYSLPRGCKLAEVEKDIRRYQCFEFENAVYCMRDRNAVQVSNFVCTIHQHILDQEQPMKLITIVNEDKESWTFEERSESFLTLMGFKKAVTSRGNFQWNSGDQDYGKYLSRMMDKMGKGRMITELGWQPEGFFAMCNAAINGTVQMYDRHGCVEVNGEQFYVPSGNIIYQRDENKHLNAKRVELIDGVNFETFAAQLKVVHREHSMLALCFQVATLFSDYIFARVKGFPLLFLYGSAGSGKDQLIQACQSMCGYPQAEITLSGASTDKGQMRMLAEFVNISLNLAEFKAGMRKEQFEFLKAIWGRIPYRRGNIVGRFTTDSVPIRSTAFVSGNDYPNQDDALMTRLIVEEMHKSDFNATEREQFGKLKRMVEHGFSGMLADILKHRKEFESTWYDQYYIIAQDIIDQALTEKHIDGRMQTNLSILLSTFLFFRERLKWPFTVDELVSHMVKVITRQQEKRSSGSEVANWWHCFIAAARKHKIKEGTHFRVDADLIAFYWDEVHAVYLETHREVIGEPGKSSATIRGKLEHHACWAGAKASYRIGKRKSSAYLFYMSKTGTDLEGLLMDAQVSVIDDLPL